jgi:hypothetical protein
MDYFCNFVLKFLKTMNTLLRKMYGGLKLFSIPIQTKRQRLLNDPEVIDLMRIARMSILEGETMEDLVKRLKQ